MEKRYILGIDIGYGDVKVVIGTVDGNLTHQFKFSSAIAKAHKVSIIRDPRILEIDDESIYVGKDALGLPSSDIVDITDYDMLEKYAPAFIYQALLKTGIESDEIHTIVSGLSVAQLDQSGYFKERIKEFTINGKVHKFDNVYLLPQGAGSKLTFDTYGTHFPEPRNETSNHTFVGCDIGFNTLDLFYVNDGKTSPNLFEGIPGEGVMRIAGIVQQHIKNEFDRNITLREAADIITSKRFKLRGKSYDVSNIIAQAQNDYQALIKDLIESKYGEILDKCDFICMFGGGAYYCGESNDFFRIVGDGAEYYNAVGFYLYGANKANK